MKTQKIKRTELREIYSQVCESWQSKIGKLCLDQSGDWIEVEESLIQSAYKEADADQKKLLAKNFDVKKLGDIKDKVKTFKDALNILGLDEQEVLPFQSPKNKRQKSANAFVKIQVISEALNEGRTPDFSNQNEYKYYPYFVKKGGRWSVGCCSYVYGGALVGAGCFFKSSELALYAGNQFLDIYADYLPE